jgi:RNA polymerase sigma-70 factor (ECF subfamily)
LILFHQQEWSIRVIAQHLGIPEGTVKSHLHRGRKRLRILLEPHRIRIENEAEVFG